MRRIKGVTIFLHRKKQTGTDPFGEPLYDIERLPVSNVLIAPVSTEDRINSLNLTGKKAVYQLAIPKGDQHEWEDQTVEFFGKKWQVFGEVLEGIEDLIPLRWNKKVMVERLNE